MEKRIPNFNTFADAIDRLIVEIQKLSFFENEKRKESNKENPDINLIAKYDKLSRDCCEFRSALKNKINECLQDIVNNGTYQTMTEVRTFSKPKKPVEDLIQEMIDNRTNNEIKEQLIQEIKNTLNLV